MARKRKKHTTKGGVELNLAAMLDMAFQLLTFFIMTFKTAPVEGQINLRLPPPAPMTKQGTAAGSDVNNTDPVKGLNTLTITVRGTSSGFLQQLAVGEARVNDLKGLDNKLKSIFSDSGNAFEQVVIQVGGATRYNELMKVVDICTNQKLPNGEKLSKLSFMEAP